MTQVATGNMIVRRVKVDRSLTLQQALDATGRRQYIIFKVVDPMPLGEGGEVDVYFFQPDSSCYEDDYISGTEIARLYELHGIKPDPRAQAKVNEDDPGFAYDYPNGCQWSRPDGAYDCVAFCQRYVKCDVTVPPYCVGWGITCWFGGVRK